MDHEAELARRAQALSGSELSRADVIGFLLDAADLLGGPPLQMLGPGIRFRWYRGPRVIEIAPARRPYSVRVSSFDRHEVVDTMEYLAFEYWEPGLMDTPYLWSALLAEAPNGWWSPGRPEVRSWSQFEATVGRLLDQLPGDLALTPQPWIERLPAVGPRDEWSNLAYLWNVDSPSFTGGVSLTATPEGVEVYSALPDRDLRILVPREMLDAGEVSMTDVVAGLTGGAGMTALRFFDTEAFDFAPETPREWEELDPLEEAATDTREGISPEALQALIAARTRQED